MANMQTKATLTVPTMKQELQIGFTQLETFNLMNNYNKGKTALILMCEECFVKYSTLYKLNDKQYGNAKKSAKL